MNWQQLLAQMDYSWTAEKPQLMINNLWCECQDFQLHAQMNLFSSDPTFVMLQSRLNEVDVSALWKYWPYQIWKEKTLNWLDRGLLAGKVETGHVFVHGLMANKPFGSGAAEFVSRAYVEQIDNQFHPDWPVVKGYRCNRSVYPRFCTCGSVSSDYNGHTNPAN